MNKTPMSTKVRMDPFVTTLRAAINALEVELIVEDCEGDVEGCASCDAVNARRQLEKILAWFEEPNA